MEKKEILSTLLKYYKSTFDIEEPSHFEDVDLMAYCRFYAKNEKFFVTEGTKIWSYNSNEHLLIIDYDSIADKGFSFWEDFIATKAEPKLVRNNEKLPSKNHEYSYITLVFIHDSSMNDNFTKELKKYYFYKNYLFSIRGYCCVRLVSIDASTLEVESDRSGKDIKKLYNKILSKAKSLEN